MMPERSEKSYFITLMLCLFLGPLGLHRFYVGKNISGLIQLLTFGGLGIWASWDFFVIVFNKFTDKDGKIVM